MNLHFKLPIELVLIKHTLFFYKNVKFLDWSGILLNILKTSALNALTFSNVTLYASCLRSHKLTAGFISYRHYPAGWQERNRINK